MKRHSDGFKLGDWIGERVVKLLKDVLAEVGRCDPVGGSWFVYPQCHVGIVWCDANLIGLGVVLQMDGVVVEDAAWLRKKEDNTHINVAELEAVVKGVNLALKWNIRRLQIMTDSTTVFGWLKCIIQNSKRVKTKGVAEMLVKRRLGVIKQLSVEYGTEIRWNGFHPVRIRQTF